MANDPEARASGSSAVIIAVVALILIVGLAFVLMNRGDNAGDTTVVNPPSTTVVETPDAPDVNVSPPDVNVTPPATDGGDAAGGSDAGGGNP